MSSVAIAGPRPVVLGDLIAANRAPWPTRSVTCC
jgi:hypothetical protein